MSTLDFLQGSHENDQAPSLAQGSFHESVTSRKPRWPWVLLGVIIVVCLLCAPLVYAAIGAGTHARSAKQSLQTAYAQMSARSFKEAQTSLETTRLELVAARASWQWVGPWGLVPWVSTQVQAVDNAFEAGSIGLDAAEQVLQAAVRIQDAFDAVSQAPGLSPDVASHRSFRDLSPQEKRSILARIDQTLPEIRAAREKALIALDAWDRIPQDKLLPQVRAALAPVTATLATFRDRSQIAIDLAGVMLPMVGYPQPKTYIVLLQNADELRPTGGFIGTVGVVRVDSGELTDQSFQDVYAFDRTASSTVLGPPPEPLKRQLGVDAWYLRDSNWSPDVPQTADRISQLFQRQGWLAASVSSVHVETADGVILLEPGLFTSLLRFTGPVTVDGITFSADGFFDQLQYAVEVGFAKQGIPVEERKKIISKIGEALIARLTDQPAKRWVDLFDLALDAFAKKDAMVVMRDPALAKAFDVRNWSGRARGAIQDELWVVDANLAALKTDGVMDKRVDYQVDATDPAGLTATVRLTYTNTNRSITWRYTRYRDYVRIFVPEGSELISSQGAMAKDLNQSGGQVLPGTVDVMKDLGKTVFGAFWSIEPGQTRTLSFTYRLPERVRGSLMSRGVYSLLLQKQPGAKQRLTIDLRLGKKLVAATPPEAPEEYGDDRYRTTVDMEKDAGVEVRVK